MKAVILAGGKGTRLRPYTTVFPKPLVPVGDMPILEIVLRQLKRNGIEEITLAVGHLAGLIKAFFGNGEKLGLNITYSMEDKPLGTVGPLSLIDGLVSDFLVMNGDLLTTLSYSDLIDKHKEKKAMATIAVHRRDVKIDLGVLKFNEESNVTEYIEKPTYHYWVSMGVYVFSPDILKYAEKNKYLDFPDLIHILLEKEKKVYGYQSNDYWLDIGRQDDYQEAIEVFESKKHLFLGD
ncbi:MAG: sugar phosphate nucleotidyltransferase [Sedimentisphaerales bacterium]